MPVISKRAAGIAPSVTLAITAKAKQMKKEGIDIVGFGAGEPDFDTPDNIKEAAKKAIDEGFTKYTPASGIPELKQAVCDKLKRENNLDYKLSEVIISCGGKHSLYNIMEVLLDHGDEAILPAPYWVTYEEQIKMAGAKPMIVDMTETGLKLTAESIKRVISDRTKLLILNTPSNPTGMTVEEEELKKIAHLAVEHDFYIVSDEVYEHLIYGDNSHISIASLGEDIKKKTITMNAVSKTYSMTGWRIGYCAGPEEIIKAMSNLQSHSTSNPCSIAQKAALEALNGPQEFLAQWRKEFDERRKYMVEKLNQMKGINCIEPEGAFYAFPDISGTGLKSMEFTEMLLDEAKVAVVPGKDFGADNNIRLSYAISMENIKKGLERLEKFCESLSG
ncbi:aminotransferase class I/II-fold pyridoxal phosphate-dependent enzyme [Candidatus Woesearchaeota archaeon]|nr:aminotransferase class I/II-fold pyridoxal phosphate-dependent enzyme [Candidatus Woesearchaeota archaeon]